MDPVEAAKPHAETTLDQQVLESLARMRAKAEGYIPFKRPADRKVVVLLSGGMDSTVLLYHYLSFGNHVLPIAFDYGQRHSIELDSARAVLKYTLTKYPSARIEPLQVINMRWFAEIAKGSSQTDDSVPVPHGHYTDESMKATVVPNRNMVMISIATSYAISQRAHHVAIANHAGDHAIYPDCRAAFINAIAGALDACDWHPPSLLAPFTMATKAEICKRGEAFNAPLELTWSCYDPQFPDNSGPMPDRRLHCGQCGTCVERREAFELAGVRDLTAYKSVTLTDPATGKEIPF